MSAPVHISVVTPAYKCAECITEMHRRLTQVLSANPALLAPLYGAAGGAPVHCVGGQCIGCGHCVSKRADTVRGFLNHAAQDLA